MSARSSAREIAQYLYGAGFRGWQLLVMTAIALRESRGRMTARCVRCIPKPGGGFYDDDSHGWFQINVAPGAHPQYDPVKLETDPEYSARAAWEVSGSGAGNFWPWQTPHKNPLYGTDLTLVRRELAGLFGLDGVKVPAQLARARERQSDAAGATPSSPSTSTTSSRATSGTVSALPAGYSIDPKNPVGSVLGALGDAVFGGFLKGVRPIVYTGVFLGGGVALIALGAYRSVSSSPTAQKAKDDTKQAAGAVAAVA